MLDVAAFYQFAPLPQCAALRAPIQALCDAHGAKGIVLLAPEGINGTIAAAPGAMARVLAGIRDIAGLPDLRHKISHAEKMPFLRMKVRVKAEIVTLGTPADPSARLGAHVAPGNWNALLAERDVVLLDTRNAYEIAIGSFPGALDPGTGSFRQFPEFVRQNLDPARHRRIAMFCTGGIRCEKASSYLLDQGFAEVLHLDGGILNYLEKVPSEESLWQGACFVFDERVAVGHGVALADVALCRGCRAPLAVGDRASSDFEEGVCCKRCAGSHTPEQKASARERQRQVELATARGRAHLGPAAGAEGGR